MKAAVIGAGSWGTALAVHAARLGHSTVLWTRSGERAATLASKHRNERDLPGVEFPPPLAISADLREAVSGRDVLVLAVPSHTMRGTLATLAPHLPKDTRLLNAAKGLERDSLKRMSAVARDVLGESVSARWATLSGPSFAQEVAEEQPTVVALASENADCAAALQKAFAAPRFRIYSTTDLTGVELGGSFKNVIAIASGIVKGLGFGYNTQAALMTRGLVEMARLAVTEGARTETLMGASGIGDLFLTCHGHLSRNRQLGERLGRGESPQDAMRAIGHVAEGARTAGAMCEMARRDGVETPIAEQVRAVLEDGRPPREALEELLRREPKEEGLRLS